MGGLSSIVYDHKEEEEEEKNDIISTIDKNTSEKDIRFILYHLLAYYANLGVHGKKLDSHELYGPTEDMDIRYFSAPGSCYIVSIMSQLTRVKDLVC